MTESSPTYRLPTAIAMIVGICIGSGIFFKSDNILIATGGNVPLGILVFLLGAVGIIFGGLSIGQLAARTAQPGGLIAYAAEFVGPGFTGGVGWFQVFFIFQRLSPLYPARLGTIFAACFPFRTHWKRSAWWGSFFSRSAFLEYLFRKAGWDLAKRGHRTQAPPAPAYRCLRFVFRKSGGNHRPFCQIACRGRMDFRHRANCVCLRWMGHRHRHLS